MFGHTAWAEASWADMGGSSGAGQSVVTLIGLHVLIGDSLVGQHEPTIDTLIGLHVPVVDLSGE